MKTLKAFILFFLVITSQSKFLEYPPYTDYSYNKNLIEKVIANGLIVTGLENNHPFLGQLLIHNGRVSHVYTQDKVLDLKTLKDRFPKSEIYNAEGKIVIPGGVDSHVHLEYPQGGHHIESSDDFFTGSVAALCGGTTTFLDFVEPDRDSKESLVDALKKRIESAKNKSVIDFSFHMTINYFDDSIEKQIYDVIKFWGINSFKIYNAYDNIRLEDEEVFNIFKALKKNGGLPIIHAEYDDLIKYRMNECIAENYTEPKYQPYCHPSWGEDESISKLIIFAKQIKLRQGIHIVHVTSGSSLPYIENAQKEGYQITGEVCSQHLTLSDEVYSRENGADFISSPPMRPQNDVESMWKGVKENILDFVISDHCPFTTKQRRGQRVTPDFRNEYEANGEVKRVPKGDENIDQKWWKNEGVPPFFNMPDGVPGIETRMFVVYQKGVVEKRISLEKFVQITSTKAAKRYKLYPKKGAIIPGSDADIVIIDPEKKMKISEKTLHQNVDFTPYEGMEINAQIKTIFLQGEKVFDNYHLLGDALKRRGNYLTRKSFNG